MPIFRIFAPQMAPPAKCRPSLAPPPAATVCTSKRCNWKLSVDQWDVTTTAPSVESVDNLWFGVLLDPHQATVTHDLGPRGGSAEVIICISVTDFIIIVVIIAINRFIPVSEMTYTVSSGTLTLVYHTIPWLVNLSN